MPNGKGYTITYNGVPSTDIPELGVELVRRKMFGKSRDVLREVAGREGAWRFGEKKGLRGISVDAYILAPSFPVPRRETLVQVADWVDVEKFAPMVISDEPDRYYMAILASDVDIDEWRHLGKFRLDFLAEPYAYDLTISEEEFSFGMGSVPVTFPVPDKLVGYPIVEVTATGGSLAGFTVHFNNYSLFYEGVVPMGESVTISSLSYVVMTGPNTDTELQGNFDPDSVSMVDVSGTFPAIVPSLGDQYIDLEHGPGSTAVTADVRVLWRRRYR